MPDSRVSPTKSALHKLARFTSGAGLIVGTLCVVVIAVATIADVVGRQLLGSPVAGVVELCSVLLVGAAFLNLGAAQLNGSHIRVTLLADRLPEQRQRLLRLALLIVCSLFLVSMTWISLDRAIDAVEVREHRFGLINIPVWPARIAVAVGWLIWLVSLFVKPTDTED